VPAREGGHANVSRDVVVRQRYIDVSEESRTLHLFGIIFDPEHGGSVCFRNTGVILWNFMALRIPSSKMLRSVAIVRTDVSERIYRLHHQGDKNR
jgi:hypothetical protein